MTGRGGTAKTSGDAPPRRQPQLPSQVGALVLVGAAYYLGARLGLSLSLVRDNVTPLWPPTGIAVAAFLLWGRKMWPAVGLAAFAVNLPISEGPLPAAVTAAGNVLAPLVAVALLGRVGFRRQLDRQRDALAIVFLGALASMLISATIGALTLVVSGAIPLGPAARGLGGVVDRGCDGGPGGRPVPVVSSVVLGAEDLAVATLGRGRHDPGRGRGGDLVGGVLRPPPAVPGAARAGVGLLAPQLRGAAPAALIASLVVTWSAAGDLGLFERGSLFEKMLTLQAFNACVALTSFFLAALVSDRIRAADALEAAAAELEERVLLRTAELSAANARLSLEIRERSAAEEQLSHEEARAQRDHEIAETLQRSLLPDRLPEIPDVALAARYVPATADVQVGGDWYDVVQLPGGLIGLAIGDVAGHGLPAAATMGQLRMALRAYALQDPSPVSVMSGVHQLVSQLPMAEMVTLMYLVFDPATRMLRFTNAGHPPALVIDNGTCVYLEDGLAPPVGVTAYAEYTEVSQELSSGATLLLYTDGLVERRGVSIQDGLDRLSLEAAANWDVRPRGACAIASCRPYSSRTRSPTTSPSWRCDAPPTF